jgi:hypothetical protein
VLECLVSEAELANRLAAREARRGERARVRCKRLGCRKAIPEGKRADAVYCSERCARAARWAERDALVREFRHTIRAGKAAGACACGAALDTRFRPGPVPGRCGRCYQREYQRRRRAAKRDGG